MKQLIFSLISFLFYSGLFLYCLAKKPLDAVVVYSKGEGGYYCQRIPTLYRTISGTLLAMAEGRGKDGRTSCDDWAVSVSQYFFPTSKLIYLFFERELICLSSAVLIMVQLGVRWQSSIPIPLLKKQM